jgi:L-threonylcarbamoyladenylate synthase
MNRTIHWKNKEALIKASEILLNGGIIIYPTDTLYGFGCDAKNEKAINRINLLKNRISPMSVIAPSKEIVNSWLNIKEAYKKEALSFIDGGRTIIVPVYDNIVSKNICGENNSLGIRIPNHPFCTLLSNNFPNPITTTSVNRTKMPAMTDLKKIYKEFSEDVNLIVEDGNINRKGSEIRIFNKGIWVRIR